MADALIFPRMTEMAGKMAAERLTRCDSYMRIGALACELHRERNHCKRLALFLEWWPNCDAPWAWRSLIAEALRPALQHVSLLNALRDEERAWFDSLPSEIAIYRGCDHGRERGLSWTTNIEIAKGFAAGKRCANANPTLVSAIIPKQHVFGIFLDRQEQEIAVDPRRLRQVRTCHRGEAIYG